jgi:hypothetical protein
MSVSEGTPTCQPGGSMRAAAPNVTSDVPIPSTISALSRFNWPIAASSNASAAVSPVLISVNDDMRPKPPVA